MTSLRRRTALRALAAAGVGAIAGCNSSPGDSGDGSSGGDGGNGGNGEGNSTDGNGTEAGPDPELDPVFHEKLTADDGDTDDHFGRAVDLAGDVALVGAPGDDQPNGRDGGSAYVFRRSGGAWRQEAKLAPDDGDETDRFGSSVAVGDGTAVVGAVADDHPGTPDSGSVYVFERAEGSWSQVAALAPEDRGRLDAFGTAVALEGDTLAVGAPSHAGNNGTDAGAVYVYDRAGESWSRQTKIAPFLLDRADRFGGAVGLAGETLLVGAPGDEDPNGSTAGTVYPFERANGDWERTGRIVPEDGDDEHHFGDVLSLAGDRVAVGAPGHPENGVESGAAYVFDRVGGDWVQRARLLPGDGDSEDRFGDSIAVMGDVVVAGAPRDEEPNGPLCGSAYIFEGSADSWSQLRKVSARHGRPEDNFGWSVAVSTELALAGTPREDLDQGHSAGAAHFYSLY